MRDLTPITLTPITQPMSRTMQKVFNIVAGGVASVAAVFCVFLTSALLGYGNAMVMLWMLAGPILLASALLLLGLFMVVKILRTRLVNSPHILFLALGLSMLGFVILELFEKKNIMVITLSTIVGISIALLLARIKTHSFVEVLAIILVLISWHYNNWHLIMPLTTSYLITLSLVNAIKRNNASKAGYR